MDTNRKNIVFEFLLGGGLLNKTAIICRHLYTPRTEKSFSNEESVPRATGCGKIAALALVTEFAVIG